MRPQNLKNVFMEEVQILRPQNSKVLLWKQLWTDSNPKLRKYRSSKGEPMSNIWWKSTVRWRFWRSSNLWDPCFHHTCIYSDYEAELHPKILNIMQISFIHKLYLFTREWGIKWKKTKHFMLKYSDKRRKNTTWTDIFSTMVYEGNSFLCVYY